MSIRKAILTTSIVILVLLLIAPILIHAVPGFGESSDDTLSNKMLRFIDPLDEPLHYIDSHDKTLPYRNPLEKPMRYVNPLVMENAGRLADPTVIRFKGKYYLHLTGGIMSAKSSGAGV